MEKEKRFSYAVEFYHRDLFSLDDTELYKNKVNEAEEVEKYFSTILPNVEHVRPYILLSYKMNKDITKIDRINYVKGLVYALDFIDFEDIKNIPKEYDYVDEAFDEANSDKVSLWQFTGYLSDDVNGENILSRFTDDYVNKEENIEEEEIDYDLFSKIAKNNSISITPKDFSSLCEIINNNETTIVEDDYDLEEDIQKTKENLEELNGQPVALMLAIEEKVAIFKKYSNDYINACVNSLLEKNKLNEEDTLMFACAMNDWFTLMFDTLDDLMNIRKNTLDYKNKNIVNFL